MGGAGRRRYWGHYWHDHSDSPVYDRKDHCGACLYFVLQGQVGAAIAKDALFGYPLMCRKPLIAAFFISPQIKVPSVKV